VLRGRGDERLNVFVIGALAATDVGRHVLAQRSVGNLLNLLDCGDVLQRAEYDPLEKPL
jgi:hypothetical protein